MQNYQVERIEREKDLLRFVQICDGELDARMETAVKTIAKEIDNRFFGLTGPTCSGKTTAAKKLTDFLQGFGRRVHIISVDDFYKDKEWMVKKAKENQNHEVDFDSEDALDLELFEAVTQDLFHGRSVRMPKFEFVKGTREAGEWIEPNPEDVFLFEGIQILYPGVREILKHGNCTSFAIFPQSSITVGEETFLPNEIRFLRRIVRDFRYRGASPSFTNYLWRGVRENEEKSIFPFMDLCEVKIDSTLPYEIGMLKPYLVQLLSDVPEEDEFYPGAVKILRKLENVQEVPVEMRGKKSLYWEFI